jgi:hypothetical protein
LNLHLKNLILEYENGMFSKFECSEKMAVPPPIYFPPPTGITTKVCLLGKDGIAFVCMDIQEKVLIMYAETATCGALSPRHADTATNYLTLFRDYLEKRSSPEDFLQQLFGDPYPIEQLKTYGIYTAEGLNVRIEEEGHLTKADLI